MIDKTENNEKSQNYMELTENQIFEKIKKDLNPIQENLAEKKITINEAKSELKKINEWLQWTKLENKDKKEIWKAFEKLTKLEKNIDENTLKNEVNEMENAIKESKQIESLYANAISSSTQLYTKIHNKTRVCSLVSFLSSSYWWESPLF